MAFSQVAVSGTVNLSNNSPAKGASVTFTLNTAITDGTQIVEPQTLTTRVANDGTFTITLNANDDSTTTPFGTYYAVAVVYQNQALSSFNVVIPHTPSTANLFSLAQLPNPNVTTPYVTSINGQNGVLTLPQIGALASASNLADVADAGTSRLNLHISELAACRVAATTNITLSGLQTIDGYTTLANDLVLLTGQSTASQNGPWLAASGAWTRPHEYGAGLSVVAGRTVSVVGGTSNKGPWALATAGTIVVDTTATSWKSDVSPSVGTSAAQEALSLTRDFALNTSMGAGALLTAIESALVSAVSANRTLSLDNKMWPINAPLLAPLASSVIGPTCQQTNGGSAVSTALTIFPQGTPPVSGGGFIQQATGADIVQFTGAGASPEWRNIVLQFAAPFVNTGHGLLSKAANDLAGQPDYGAIGGILDNVLVYGQDGNHYAFELWNWELCKLARLRGWGGGGWHFVNDSDTLENGNCHFEDIYMATFIGGSAHVYWWDNHNAAPVDFAVHTRVQGWLANITLFNSTPQPAGTVAPTNAQFSRKVTGSWVSQKCNDSGDDLESTVTGNVVQKFVGPGNDFPDSGSQTAVTASGTIYTSTASSIREVGVSFTLNPLAANQEELFVGNTGTASIKECSAAGMGLATLLTPISVADGIAADSTYLYYSNTVAGAGYIGRANLDGSGNNATWIATTATNVQGVAVNASNVYWCDTGNGRIGQATIAGGSINDSFITGCSTPSGITLDGSFIYWAEAGTNTLGRATLAGGTINHSFVTGATGCRGVSVNATNLFWTSFSTSDIGTATIAGASPNATFITGGAGCYGITQDATFLYWTNFSNGTIGRATLAGGSVNQAFVSGLSSPTAIFQATVLGAATVLGFVNGNLDEMWVEPAGGSIGRVVTSKLLVPSGGTYQWVWNNAAVNATVYSNTMQTVAVPTRPALGW